jgi:CBS domain-containing protein
VVENEHLCGVITDRDIVVGCDARGVDAHRLRVADLMSREVRCCHEDDDAAEVLEVMAREHVRRMPVLLHHMFPRVVGVVSIDDLADATDDTHLVKDVLDTRHKPQS